MALVGLLLVPMVWTLTFPSSAGAHGGPGSLGFVSKELLPDGRSVKLTLSLTYAGDGDPATGATMTIVPELIDGPKNSTPPVPVKMTEITPAGTYAATVTLPGPGNWRLRVTAVEPAASAIVPVAIAGTMANGSVVTSTTAPPSTTTPPTSAGGSTTTAPPEGVGNPFGGARVFLLGLVVLVVGGLAAVGVGRRRSDDGGADSGGSDGSGS
ncbi:MAG: hypothetical protein ACKOYM_06345 [Actinomycetes bacterium]